MPDRLEAGAYFHPLGGVDPHESMGNIRVEPVKNRFTPARRYSIGNDGYFGTHRIALLAQRIHVVFQACYLAGIRPEKWILLHRLPGKVFRSMFSQCRQISPHMDAVPLIEVFFGNGPGSNTHGCLPRGRATTPAIITDAVFVDVCVVSMPRPKLTGNIRVILGALVRVMDNQSYGCARGHTLEHARQDLYLVQFPALGGVTRLARTPAIQVRL